MRKEIILALFSIYFGKLPGQRLFPSEDLEKPYHVTGTPKKQ